MHLITIKLINLIKFKNLFSFILYNIHYKRNIYIQYLTILSAFCYAVYWFSDNKIFLARLKVIDNVNVKQEVIRGHRYWLVGLLIVMYLFVGKMNKLYQQRKELKSSSNELNDNNNDKTLDEIDNELFLKRVQFFGYCCDVLVALNNAGYMEKIKGSKLNDGQYGIVGFISSITVLYRLWPSN